MLRLRIDLTIGTMWFVLGIKPSLVAYKECTLTPVTISLVQFSIFLGSFVERAPKKTTISPNEGDINIF